jgi:hypothetical protein
MNFLTHTPTVIQTGLDDTCTQVTLNYKTNPDLREPESFIMGSEYGLPFAPEGNAMSVCQGYEETCPCTSWKDCLSFQGCSV